MNIGWFAGMFDGEGCLSLNLQKNSRFLLGVSVTNTNIESLELFQLQFGGRVAQHSGRSCWRWRLSGRDKTKAFLETILPYLVIKKKQAQLVLDYLSTVKDSRVYFGIHNRLTFDDIQKRKSLVTKLSKKKFNLEEK